MVSCCLSLMRRNSNVEVLRSVAVILQEEVACKSILKTNNAATRDQGWTGRSGKKLSFVSIKVMV